MTEQVEFYTSNATELYAQKGPGREVYYLGLCHTLDSLPDNPSGRDAVICVTADGDLGVIGKKKTAPGLSEFDIESLLLKSASYLERWRCPFTLLLAHKCTGKKGTMRGWERAEAAIQVEYVGGPVNNALQRDADDEITVTKSWNAMNRRLDWYEITTGQKTTAEDQDANSIDVYPTWNCGGRCAELLEPGEIQVVVYDSDGVAAANVEYSLDFGNTWTAAANQPFAISENIVSVRFVQIDNDTVRTLVVRDGDAADNLEVAYSDDRGATAWTLADVGATNNEAATRDQSMFVLDASNIWICTDDGRVFKSTDAGVTWVEQTTALVASGAAALHCIVFYNEKLGVAAGAGDVIILTTDGGVNWAAATATGGGGDIYTINFIEPFTLICGDDDGNVWLSFDRSGSAWEILTTTEYPDAGTGDVNNIKVVDQQTVFLASIGTTNAYVYRSVTGGRIFERVLGTVLTSAVNAVAPVDKNWAMACGEDDGAIGVILGVGSP